MTAERSADMNSLLTNLFCVFVVGGCLVSCGPDEQPAAANPPSAAATPHRFTILESTEQPEGYVLLRMHDSDLGQLAGGGVVHMPVYGECGELSIVESMLNFVAAHTTESEIGTISRVACSRDGYEMVTVKSLPCGCDLGKHLQVVQDAGEFTIASITDWKDKAPDFQTLADQPMQPREPSAVPSTPGSEGTAPACEEHEN